MSKPFPKDIRYTATIDRDEEYFSGSYSAQKGYDIEHFSLKKHYISCIILCDFCCKTIKEEISLWFSN